MSWLMQLLYSQVHSVAGNIHLTHIDNEILVKSIFTKECIY